MKKLLSVFIIISFISCNKEKKQSVTPEIQSITESVYSSVTIQPDSLYEVYSAVTGILEKSFVEEGSLISENQPIFKITNDNPKLNTENARLTMEMAKDNYNGKNPILTDLKNEVNLAKLKYTNDSINYSRQKTLWDKNIGSKVDYDSKKLQFETTKQQLSSIKNKYLRTQKELKQQVEQAANNYKASLYQTKDFTVKSKLNGVVYSIYRNVGELISAQQPIAAIGSKNNFIAELLIDEVDIAKIEINQKVLISLEAYKNQTFEAKVTKIYPQKNERSQTFKIEALFIEMPTKLYPGLSGEANIVISKKENCLTIQKIYFNDGKVLTDDGEVEVETGLESLDKIEILSGIDKTTKIYLPTE